MLKLDTAMLSYCMLFDVLRQTFLRRQLQVAHAFDSPMPTAAVTRSPFRLLGDAPVSPGIGRSRVLSSKGPAKPAAAGSSASCFNTPGKMMFARTGTRVRQALSTRVSIAFHE